MCEARVPVLGILAFRICGFRILPSESLALKSVCGEFECRVLPVFEIPALTIYNRRAGIHIAFMHSSPQTLEIYSIRPPKSWNLQHFQCKESPKSWNLQPLSVQGGPQILEFAAFAEFPVFGSKKLNWWSAPRTRSERDQNEMQIRTFWPPTQAKTGIALKVLPKQAFKFKNLRN